MTAADNLCERLIAWDVNTIYGFPGDGINGILGALRRHEDELRFVQTRHEEMAAFMACGHAKFTGEVGVCMATSGPGAIHLLNGLYDAKLDHQPVVAIVGQTFVRAIGGDFQQEVNLLQLYSDVASAFCEQVNEPSSVRHLIDRAIRIAKSRANGHLRDRARRRAGHGSRRGSAAQDPHRPLRHRLLAGPAHPVTRSARAGRGDPEPRRACRDARRTGRAACHRRGDRGRRRSRGGNRQGPAGQGRRA